MKRDSPKQILFMAAFGLVPAVWLGLLTAPAISGGGFAGRLPELMGKLTAALNDPLHIEWTEAGLKTALIFIAVYVMAIGIYLVTRRNTRPREEHGSAKWGEAAAVNRKYADRRFTENKILTRNVRIGFAAHKHKRNLNVMVVGGSGAGKTRAYAKPNAMQANSSMVILDPKGEITRDTGRLLAARGMDVKVLDLINPERSHCYNPFVYFESDNDVQRLVTNLFKATTPKGSQTQDPFWETAASMLLMALVFYLHYEAPEDERNFQTVMEMLRSADVREEDELYQSPLDTLFERLEMRSPDHIALKYYHDYRAGAGKTLKSIQITLAARLEKFNLESLAALTVTDELDLGGLGEKKTALFVIIPDNDASFNFLVSILYTQLFQQLFHSADHKHGGSLPVHVHFIMDEFANVSLPDDFDKILSVMRSRGVSVSIILQNLAQLKALFEKQWESLVGNCDEFLYLGGNEQSTHKYVSELLGKSTIDTNTYGKSTGRNGNYSTNYQQTGRELLTPDEVRMLDNRYALLFIRGERPIMDGKFDLLRHPRVDGTADGKAEPFRHGAVTESVASVVFDGKIDPAKLPEIALPEGETYELLSEEDLEQLFNQEEESPHEKDKQTQ
jgi:type IV secretion system protein VirD4